MSLQEYEAFVYSATYSDSDDPVSAWNAVAKRQKKVVEWLLGKKQVHVRGRYIDITFSIDGRTFISCDGHLNMPDGEVFTGPVDGTVNGWFESSFPAVEYGVDVGKVAFRFEDGIAVRAEAEKNQDHLTKMLETDEGARRVGEFGIGTNDRIKLFTKNMLFDEKIGGTIHLAVGRAYPETGAKNESAIHWDFLCDMKDGGQIIVDDQVLYESGKFAV
jgi:aminopeptidase